MEDELKTQELIDKEKDYFILTKESVQQRIYDIRGEKVMLDFELAEIYGYETRRLNEQVKNNWERFDGFAFQLTKEEASNLVKSKKSTSRNIKFFSGQSGGTRKLPYAFTEIGIYMLMTVLRGPLAVEQARKLVVLFKELKDYVVTTNHLLSMNEVCKVVNQVNKNTSDIQKIQNQLDVMADNFIDPSRYKEFLILDGNKFEADVKYMEIYALAHRKIIIIDDYISNKTLSLLKNVSKEVEIIIYSDNVSKDKVVDSVLEDYKNETSLVVSLVPTQGKFHDRYILIDDTVLYVSGPSSKDAGNKIATLIKIEDVEIVNSLKKKIENSGGNL